jgi:hypothetical protein
MAGAIIGGAHGSDDVVDTAECTKGGLDGRQVGLDVECGAADPSVDQLPDQLRPADPLSFRCLVQGTCLPRFEVDVRSELHTPHYTSVWGACTQRSSVPKFFSVEVTRAGEEDADVVTAGA